MSLFERTHCERLCKALFAYCRVWRTSRYLFWHSTPRSDTLQSVAATENEAYCPCQSYVFVGSLFISVNVFVSLFMYNYKFRRKNQNRKLYVSTAGYGSQVVSVFCCSRDKRNCRLTNSSRLSLFTHFVTYLNCKLWQLDVFQFSFEHLVCLCVCLLTKYSKGCNIYVYEHGDYFTRAGCYVLS